MFDFLMSILAFVQKKSWNLVDLVKLQVSIYNTE